MLSTRTGSAGRAFLIALRTSSPLRSGRLMSSITMSHCWDRTSSIASAPFAASPTGIGWAVSESIRRNPARVMVWSSTISALVMSHRLAIVARALWNLETGRELHQHAGSAALGLLESHVAAKSPGPFAHALNAAGLRFHDLAGRQADAVVTDPDQDAFAVRAEVHIHPRRTRVARNIRQRFLENAKHGRLRVVLENDTHRRRIDLAGYAEIQFEFLQLPLQRRPQAQMVENAWPQFRGDAPHRLDGGIDQFDRFAKVVRTRQPVVHECLREPLQIHLGGRQRGAEFVVDLPGDGGSLGFARGLQVRRQLAQFLARSAQRLFHMLALLDFLA